MGTTMSFYLLENRGFALEELSGKVAGLQEKVSVKAKAQEAFLYQAIRSSLSPEQQKAWKSFLQEIEQGMVKRAEGHRKEAVLAYRPDAKWLPLFTESLCEGRIASSRDAAKLAETFGTPVLAFSIFDSDVLFVSYADPGRQILEDYAKPNVEGFEEYDGDQYQQEFPRFLCAYGEEATLREAWEGEEVFADDRMAKLCEAIGAQLLYDADELPAGFRWIE